MHDRGLVITAPFTVQGSSATVSNRFDAVSLRQYLLYWDKLEWPNNNRIEIYSGPDIDFLASVGVLERTFFQFDPSIDFSAAMLRMQIEAFEKRNVENPGAWSLAQHAQVLASVPEVTAVAHVIEMELFAALPVPTEDASLADVLEFKQRRRDELMRLRDAMDSVYLKVIMAGDVPRAKLQEIARLESSLRDLHAAFSESFPRRLLSTLKVELNSQSLATAALAGAATAATFGLPLAAGAAAGAVAAAVKFEVKYIRKAQRVPESLRDYAYLHHVVQELR